MEIAEILKLRQNANGLNKLMNMHVITLDKDGGATVEVDSSINYYRPGRAGHRLTAVAYERKRGRKTSVFMVEVHDDEGKHIADATFTMFYTGQTLDDMKH